MFVDNNVTKNFKNPADPAYEELIKWLFDEGHLVLTQRLLKEYHDSNRGNYGQRILSMGVIQNYAACFESAFFMSDPLPLL